MFFRVTVIGNRLAFPRRHGIVQKHRGGWSYTARYPEGIRRLEDVHRVDVVVIRVGRVIDRTDGEQEPIHLI
jgi:hypothetical protein